MPAVTRTLLLITFACVSRSSSSVTLSSIGELAQNQIFNFDFVWSPLSPTVNDTVVFRVVINDNDFLGRESQSLWKDLPDSSFRWYQQLPKVGFFLRHIGKTYTRKANEVYFEGLYKLEVRLPMTDPKVKSRDSQALQFNEDSDVIEIPKYVSLQKDVTGALYFNDTEAREADARAVILKSSSGLTNVTCRFWGSPMVATLQFLPSDSSQCEEQIFRTYENEAYMDLITKCKRVNFGSFTCFGSNTVSARQLTCELKRSSLKGVCHSPALDLVLNVRAGDDSGKSAALLSAAWWCWTPLLCFLCLSVCL